MKYVRTTRTVNPQTTIVFCQGEMDTVAVEELHQAVDPLVEDAILHLVLDLREVDYVSSSVLQFLIETQDRMKKKGGRTSLLGAGPMVRSVIETARVDSLFGFYETLEELGISPPASKPTPVPAAGPSGKPASAGPSSKPTPTPPASGPAPARDRVAPGGPEKIFPRPRPVRDAQFWRFWGGLAALIAASLAWSIYLYLTR
jgi:anti-anti-sigma factor